MDSTNSLPDEDLALAAGAGARDAFEALVTRYGAVLLAVVEKQVDDHHLAHDLAQEIWIKAFRALPRWQPDGSFRSWLFSVALNHVRDERRKRSRSRVIYLDEFRAPPAAPTSVDPRGRAEEHAAIASALLRVPEPFRTAVHLVDVVGLSYDEAARTLACAIGTVKSRVNRGRLSFRDEYQQVSGEVSAEVRQATPN